MFRLLYQEGIHIGPVPVCVADLIVRARGHQQLASVRAVVTKRLADVVAKEAEPALEPAADLRMMTLPRAPLRERPDARQPIPIRQLFQQQVRQRRRGLADDEPWMPAAFEQHDRVPRLRSASAVSDPAKPEPMIATSADDSWRSGVLIRLRGVG